MSSISFSPELWELTRTINLTEGEQNILNDAVNQFYGEKEVAAFTSSLDKRIASLAEESLDSIEPQSDEMDRVMIKGLIDNLPLVMRIEESEPKFAKQIGVFYITTIFTSMFNINFRKELQSD